MVEKNNDYDTVIKHYKEAVKLNPNLSEAYVRLGANYLSIGLGERAVEVLKKAQELQPRDPKVRKLLKNAEQGISSDTRVLMKSDEIKNRLLAQTKDDGIKTMGPEPYTVAKGRLKFSNILFNEWSYQLHRPEAVAQVMELGAALASKDLSGYSFVIEGHTDNRGDPARNWQLSLDRANAVAQYLAAQFGLDPRRIVIQGYGFSRPRFENDTEEHMLLNRRVEVVVFQGTGQQ
jgi:outer membrane protein OmpA-like peptidoglycan-associated protein